MTIYDYEITKRDGSSIKMEEFKGKVLIIVNTATGCGFTPQYEGLENLYKKYHEKGLEILDFPCDQFGHQAPGNDDEIKGLKNKTIMMGVKTMSSTCKNKGDIIWNFTKFLVDKNGNVVNRYSPTYVPGDMEEEIQKLLG